VTQSGKLIYLIAGEPSGDLLGARLMVALRALSTGTIRFAGIGGEQMRAEGLVSLFPQADLAVMGFAEVVPRLPTILSRLRQTIADIEAMHPSVIVTIDSWGFTGRIARRLQVRGSTIPRLHYVAPMVWAWKRSRARKLAERVDRLLCLLPNEPAFFAPYGLDAVHVGHPVVEKSVPLGDGVAFRQRHHLAPDAPLLVMLPGSRHSETSRLLPIFAAAALLMARRVPGLEIAIPTVETVEAEVRREVASWPVRVRVVKAAEKWDCFAAAGAALAASGTVALELAVARVPMVIAYRVAPLTAMILRRLLTVHYVCLLNLLLDEDAIPELLQEACTASALADAVLPLLTDSAARRRQLGDAARALALLGDDGESPSLQAARQVLTMIQPGSDP
jgi:lipid-A-disaccharide synthase